MNGRIKARIIIFNVLLITGNVLFAQEIKRNAIILTYVVDDLADNHPEEHYYWILPLNDNKAIYPIYLDGFSKDDLERCINDQPVNIFVSSTTSDWNYSPEYLESLEKLKRYINENRQMLQKVKRKWSNGDKERIDIYYTLINGSFCSCKIYEESGNMINYSGEIFLPISFENQGFDFTENEVYDYIDNLNLILKEIENNL